jgi:hypothetical protein
MKVGITSGEKEFGKFGDEGLEVIRVAADLPPLDSQREGDGALCG